MTVDDAPSDLSPPLLDASPVSPSSGTWRPLGLGEVTVTGGFWGHRQELNATVTLDHVEHWLEREGWIGNFDRAAAGTLPEGRQGREFSDSEVYKYLEALAWEIGRTGRADLDARFTAIVARVAAAQGPDGYLGTAFGRPGQQPRWSDLEWGHELYCAGHLLQAAVARIRTRPDGHDGLVEIARRAADLVIEVFGPGGRESVCGHPCIEVALAEFARAVGDPRYLAQAALFVDRRGHGVLADIEWGRSYFQDDVPVRDAEVLRGHAVRAGYLAAGAVDVAVDTADEELLTALRWQWDATVARRTYLTGGQGSHHQDEAFGADWELPPDRAYSETCAGVASIMLGWRLMLADGDVRYADHIERVLYNVVATALGEDGRSFFYTNTLHQRVPGTPAPRDRASPRAHASLRAPWFAVSCCPTNIARTLATVATLVATRDDDGVQIHQYVPAQLRTSLPGGRRIELDVETAYPRDGVVRLRVLRSSDAPWTLTLRVPGWVDVAAATVIPADGAGAVVHPLVAGAARIRRSWSAGDVVELDLPVAPRFTRPDPRIDAVRGSVAVERGPEVYCLESVDLPAGTDLDEVVVDRDRPPVERDGAVRVQVRTTAPRDAPWPYSPTMSAEDAPGAGEVVLIPYHEWAQRGPSTMRVWLPHVT